jgi:hypothetical protein
MALKSATILIFLIVLCVPGVCAKDPVDSREIELERLNRAFRDENCLVIRTRGSSNH